MPFENNDLKTNLTPSVDKLKEYLQKANKKEKRDVRYLNSFLQRLPEIDSQLFGILHKRKTSPKSLKWNIRLPLEYQITPAEEEQLTATKTRFRQAGIVETFEDVVDGLLYGMSNVRLTWENTRYGTMVVRKETTDLTALDFSDETESLVKIKQLENGELSKEELDPDVNLITRFNPLKNRNSYVGSYMRSAMVLVFLKYHSRWNWRDLLERHGVPGTYASHPPGLPDEEVKKLVAMMEKLKNDAVAVFPEYVKILFESAAKSDSTDSFDRFINAVNKELAVLFHGQNLTTDVEGGSLAAARVHNEIDDLIIVGEDVAMIKKIITSQYLKQDYLLNYGEPRNDFFELVTVADEQEDYESNSRIVFNIFSDPEFKANFPIKKNELYEKLGFTQPNEDDEII